MGLSNGFTLANATDFFKRVYAGADLSSLGMRDTPTVRAVPKVEAAQGQGIVVPINQMVPMGYSGTASVAVANAYGSRGKHWILSTKNTYMRVNIDAKALAVSKDRAAAYLEGKRKETDEALAVLGMELERALWDDGSGYLGQVTSVAGGPPPTSFTLVQPLDAINLHINQILIGNTARDGSGTVRDTYRITGINRVTGAVTIVFVSNTGSDLANSDYIFIEGSVNNRISGIPAYIPASDPGTGGVPAALNNVTRTDDPVALAGWRGTNEGSIEESAKSLVARMGQYLPSGVKGALWLSYSNWRKLEQELGSRAYRDEKASARFGTGALILQTPKGDLPVVAGPYVPQTAGFLLDMDAVKLYHLRALFHMRDEDGLSAVRLDWSSDEDGIGIEFRSWPEACIERPMNCGRFPIS